MFTLLVSWLFVACIPGLLMMATLGLGRLEGALARDAATDVAKFLEQAEPADMRAPAQEETPEALDYLPRHPAQGRYDAPRPPLDAGRHHVEPFLCHRPW